MFVNVRFSPSTSGVPGPAGNPNDVSAGEISVAGERVHLDVEIIGQWIIN